MAGPPPLGTMSPRFMFATGVECSYPTIAGPDGDSVRVDELEKTFHYRHWQPDLARFPWVQFYTPVNEIYVCAKLSTLDGIWNERRKKDDRAFVTALKHLCAANLLAIREILKVRPDAVFIQSESAEYFHIGSADPE